jgi:hypothetical protein
MGGVPESWVSNSKRKRRFENTYDEEGWDNDADFQEEEDWDEADEYEFGAGDWDGEGCQFDGLSQPSPFATNIAASPFANGTPTPNVSPFAHAATSSPFGANISSSPFASANKLHASRDEQSNPPRLVRKAQLLARKAMSAPRMVPAVPWRECQSDVSDNDLDIGDICSMTSDVEELDVKHASSVSKVPQEEGTTEIANGIASIKI